MLKSCSKRVKHLRVKFSGTDIDIDSTQRKMENTLRVLIYCKNFESHAIRVIGNISPRV